MAQLRIQYVVGITLLLMVITPKPILSTPNYSGPNRRLLQGNGNGNGNNGNGNGNGNNGNNGNGNGNNGNGNGNGNNGNNGKGNSNNGNGNNGNGNGNSKTPPPPYYPTPSPPPPRYPTPSPPPPRYPTSSPPPPSYPTPSPPPPRYPTSSPPPPRYPTPSPPPPRYPTTSPPPPSTTPSSPPPPFTTPSPPPPPPPQTPTPTSPPPPTQIPSSPPPPPKVKCTNNSFPLCYAEEHTCPNSCLGGCYVDCYSCKPKCKCDVPGAVCQDPRFIGGDGITFYFHGKKDRDFCVVTDSKFHINAHFIGRRNKMMTRDFTWVQSIGIIFGNHKLSFGALKTSTWDDTVDRLFLTFDDSQIILPSLTGAKWLSESTPKTSITRISDTNTILLEVEGLFQISVNVVPITEEDSRVHNYGITNEDCFAHLELGFKFFYLSDEVNGVLGQTYRSDYVSRVKMGVPMPVMGGAREFAATGLLEPDCSVSQFDAGKSFYANRSSARTEFPGLNCSSGKQGGGVVCKR